MFFAVLLEKKLRHAAGLARSVARRILFKGVGHVLRIVLRGGVVPEKVFLRDSKRHLTGFKFQRQVIEQVCCDFPQFNLELLLIIDDESRELIAVDCKNAVSGPQVRAEQLAEDGTDLMLLESDDPFHIVKGAEQLQIVFAILSGKALRFKEVRFIRIFQSVCRREPPLQDAAEDILSENIAVSFKDLLILLELVVREVGILFTVPVDKMIF